MRSAGGSYAAAVLLLLSVTEGCSGPGREPRSMPAAMEQPAPSHNDAEPAAAIEQQPTAGSNDADATSTDLGKESAAPRRDGEWSVTVETHLPGVSEAPPNITFTQCVTKEDAEDPAKLVPLTGRGRRENSPACTISEQKLEGAKVSWRTLCEGVYPMTGVGEFVYSADRYVGTMKVTTRRGDQPYTMTMTYTGKRLGDCVK